MKQQHLCAPRGALSPDARALLAVMMTAAAMGRLTHQAARDACRLPVPAYAYALGQLERAGILPRLFVSRETVVFTVCACVACARLAGGAQ